MTWIDDLVTNLGFRAGFEGRVRPPPSDDLLARLEAIGGGSLPPDFRHYLSRYGAGFLGTDDHSIVAPIAEPCPWGADVTFSTTHALHGESLIRVQHTYRGRIPNGAVAFASDAGGNELCIDLAGMFPGSIWFWDHEQRWFREYFSGSFEEAAQELDAAGIDARRFSVHDIIRGWARLHADRFDRPPDYMGMYRMAPTFADFLRTLQRVPY